MPKKIAIDVTSCAYAPMSGTGVYVKNVVSEMMSQRVDIEFHLISSKTCDLSWANGAVVHFGEGKLSKHNIVWWAIEGNRLLSRINPDVFWNPFQFFPIGMSQKRKAVLTVLDLVWYHMPAVMEWRNYLLNKMMMKRSLKKASAIITISETTRRDLLSHFNIAGNNVYPIHLSASSEYRVLSGDSLADSVSMHKFCKRPYILAVGALEPRKNHLRLIKAIEKLRKSGYGDLNLVIAGSSGWKNDEFFDYYNNNDCGKWSSIVKDVSGEDLATLYNSAELLVFPSLMEGFGMPIVEAMYCGCPVVTSNVSSMPEVAGDAAVLVDPYDVDSIVSGIKEALERKDSLKKLSTERAKYFSWKKSATRHLEVLLS